MGRKIKGKERTGKRVVEERQAGTSRSDTLLLLLLLLLIFFFFSAPWLAGS